jgi:hypothetical protein
MATAAEAPPSAAGKVTRAGWYALFLVSSGQGLSLLDRQILSILRNSAIVTARPSRPARPVRPMRWV